MDIDYIYHPVCMPFHELDYVYLMGSSVWLPDSSDVFHDFVSNQKRKEGEKLDLDDNTEGWRKNL